MNISSQLRKILEKIVVFGAKSLDVYSQKKKWMEEEVVKVLLMMSACILRMDDLQKALTPEQLSELRHGIPGISPLDIPPGDTQV